MKPLSNLYVPNQNIHDTCDKILEADQPNPELGASLLYLIIDKPIPSEGEAIYATHHDLFPSSYNFESIGRFVLLTY